jgi:hypothetical protein
VKFDSAASNLEQVNLEVRISAIEREYKPMDRPQTRGQEAVLEGGLYAGWAIASADELAMVSRARRRDRCEDVGREATFSIVQGRVRVQDMPNRWDVSAVDDCRKRCRLPVLKKCKHNLQDEAHVRPVTTCDARWKPSEDAREEEIALAEEQLVQSARRMHACRVIAEIEDISQRSGSCLPPLRVPSSSCRVESSDDLCEPAIRIFAPRVRTNLHTFYSRQLVHGYRRQNSTGIHHDSPSNGSHAAALT